MKEIKLFDYQDDMVERVQDAFRHHDAVMVQMPTGTGKTYLLAAIVGLFSKREVWIVAHRRELVSQIKDTLERFFPSTQTASVKVMSIQWLSRHYREMKEPPSLIVIDEAHHALAETYAEVINAYPKTKKLGLTATPYRMNGKGFTDLFDTLLCSWSMERFIAEGRLSLYDYYSIKPDSADQLLIDSLQKRGTDGDYQQKELDEVMDVRPSLERLCLTIKQYVPGKKGIVYAISIKHAEHIAEFYRENGIKAVAISSKTPLAERKKLIEKFRNTNVVHDISLNTNNTNVAHDISLNTNNTNNTNVADGIEVLVSVDLFSEGFDCPDVEFIQLARPTLSLAKYMQMVGRGLRVAKGKEYCVILDNVGLYKRFGLPSVDRDWRSMFEGKTSLEDILQEVCLKVNSNNCRMDVLMDGDEDMIKIISHERQQRIIKNSYCYSLTENEKGLFGVKDNSGNVVLDCLYKKIELTNDGFAYCHIRKKSGQKEWMDLRSGLWFRRKPQSVRLMGIDFSTEDGKKLYPRIRSKFIDEKAYLTVKTLELQVGAGLNWKRRFIPWNETDKVYYNNKGENDLKIYSDDAGNCFVQENIGSRLIHVPSQELLDKYRRQYGERYQKEQTERKKIKKSAVHYDGNSRERILLEESRVEKKGIEHVRWLRNQKEAWVDTVTNKIFHSEPTTFRRGFVSLVKEGEWCYIRNIPGLVDTPFREWEIIADDNICVIKNTYLIERNELYQWYKICKRTDDFSYFVVKAYSYEYDYIKDETEIQITQFEGEEVKMTSRGMNYTPFVIRTHKRELG